jgi:replicative DNA helicase
MSLKGNAEVSSNLKDKFSDKGSERMVLSCVLNVPDLLIDVTSRVAERDFLSDNHRALYSILASLYGRGIKTFDIMAVVNEATDKGMLKLVGGAEYIDALMYNPVNPANLDVYLLKVLECSTKYKLYRRTEAIQDNILANVGPSDDVDPADILIAKAETDILEVSMAAKQVDDAINIASDLAEVLKSKQENPVDVMGLSSNIVLLDKAINGFTPGSLSVVAARQKGGKSTLLLNWATHIAFTQGIPVLYIDTELSTAEVQMRAVSHLSQVPERLVTNGKYIENEAMTSNVWRAHAVMGKGELFHKYMPGFTMEAVKSMVRKYHAREGIGAFFFDYIKLPETTGNDSFKEHQILGNIATGLKDLAGQLNIPVIAAAQIKRGDSANPKTRFHDSDVADSDRIGRFCTNLMAIGQKTKKEIEEDGLTCGTHRLQILLARSGTPNYYGIDMHCNLPTLTMKQAEHQAYLLATADQVGR